MNSIRSWAAAGTLAFSLVAFAQPAARPAGTSPSDARALLQYRSGFDDYRAYQEPAIRSWREVNDEAASLGGHAGQLEGARTSTLGKAGGPNGVGSPVLEPREPNRGDRSGTPAEVIDALLAKPLDANAAVQVAILNHARQRASGAGLGNAEADIERIAGDTRKAWISAVAAQESLRYFEDVLSAAEAGAELAARMVQVGNLARLAHLQEQAFYADATTRLARARLAAAVERERLTRLLGLDETAVQYRLPDRLPDLPDAPVEALDAERIAQGARTAPSEVRESYQAYRTAFDIARHYRDEIVPLRKRIAEENTLRYNGMLIGVFELLADARERIASVNGYLDALRDFWLAQADFDLALNGGSPGSGTRARAATMPSGGSAGGH